MLTRETSSVAEDEIDKRCATLRKELQAKMEKGGSSSDGAPKKPLKAHQVHELADAKIKESERLRNALKISKNYEEGSHWKRQEDRLRRAMEKEASELKERD